MRLRLLLLSAPNSSVGPAKQVWLLAQAFVAASEEKKRFTIDRRERFNFTNNDVVITTGMNRIRATREARQRARD